MPLKHLTETVLVVLLALVTIVTGVLVSTLPHIPEGFFPWVIIFVATVLYPALLYPLLKSNRADNAFRMLHFAPVTITILWMFIEILLLKEPRLEILHRVYTWGYSALAVAVIFLLIAGFCLQVIRRRVPRLSFLILFFVPFIATAYASEGYTHWNTQLASLLWRTGSENLIAVQPTDEQSMLSVSSRGEKNLSHSSVAEEEAWRKKLRAVEQDNVHSLTVGSALNGVDATTTLVSPLKTGAKRIVAHRRKRLPKSGGETEALAIFLIAAFCASVHGKARARVV